MPDGTTISPARPAPAGRDRALVIGLVNAMPPAARRGAERQFRSLLDAASPRGAVALRLFALAAKEPPPDHHEPLGALWNARLDALIVTGTEPRETDITRESCWPALARVVDWAAEHTVSTIWSCFAAHAAVFHRHGIARTLLPEKLSGVFPCAIAPNHPLTEGAPAAWMVPHSRHNTLDERDLIAAGYDILSRAPDLGADIFCREEKSLFVMMQGHPEYAAETLAREYRRDVLRFLNGETPRYPEPPRNIFQPDHLAGLEDFRARALARPHAELIAVFDALTPLVAAWPWRAPAESLFARWLAIVADRARAGAAERVRR